jgi:HAD superfamily hydrolase (TIGR01509 family)
VIGLDVIFAVVFDLDGLLADTEPLWSESSDLLLRRRGHRFDVALKPHVMGRHPLEVARLFVERYGLDDEPAALHEERLEILRELYATREIPAKPGALVLVRALAARETPMAVASGSPSAILRLVADRLGLEQVAVRVGSDDVQRGKPAPDLFLLAAVRLGVAPERCVVLEDAIAGVDAARAAGMRVVAVPSPETPRERVAHADLVVDSLVELDPERLAGVVSRRGA